MQKVRALRREGRVSMKRWASNLRLFALSCLLFACAPIREVTPEHYGRAGRVVVVSPHFDEAPGVKGGFNCPWFAMQLIGYESSESSQRAPFLIRTLPRPHERNDSPPPPLQGVSIRFVSRVSDSTSDTLPIAAPWIGITDEKGLAIFAPPPGVYKVKIMGLGYQGGEGVVRIRQFGQDSIQAYLAGTPIC